MQCFNVIEWWIAGQKIGRTAEVVGNCRKGTGEGERRSRKMYSGNREIIAPGPNVSRGAKHKGKTDQGSARVRENIMKIIN